MITIWEHVSNDRVLKVDNSELMYLIKDSGKHLLVDTEKEKDYLKSLELVLGCRVRVFTPKEYIAANRPWVYLSIEGLPTD